MMQVSKGYESEQLETLLTSIFRICSIILKLKFPFPKSLKYMAQLVIIQF